jgi:hypothetical protein
MLLILLIVVAVLCFGGGIYHEPFRGPGIGLGTVLVIVLIVLFLSGRLG